MDLYRIKPKQKVDLEHDFDPNHLGDWKDHKDKAEHRLADLRVELDELQGLLYAEHKHKLLVVLQAMDTAGKDGTIRSVFAGVNPQGVQVASFKVPTPIEQDHDFLWRVHSQAPAMGELVVFNRSHYEQVLVVRVHALETEAEWRLHYRQINDFEQMLAETGTTILKFFLHINLDEQKQRLLERLDTPEKQWKFSSSDLPERKLWPQYMQAYQELLNKTSTEWAPWYVVPANHNWYRNLVVATVLVDTLKKLDMHYPAVVENLEQYRSQLKSEK
jgi:PPK2 family polyphosphate:nucleotide phosphotransferase